jgi:hypothetical protein
MEAMTQPNPGDELARPEPISVGDDPLPPGHPAADSQPVPSAGEQISRDAEELAVPGDDVLVNREHGDAGQ